MNILLLNTNNSAGGATKACYRLHKAYLMKGISSKLLINDQKPLDLKEVYPFYDWYEKELKARGLFLKLKHRLLSLINSKNSWKSYTNELRHQNEILQQRPTSLEVFTFHNSYFDLTKHPLFKWADVIHLHWVANHFFDFSMLSKINKPIIWTLHDTNPFTGGCHYEEGCSLFKTSCSPCPQLKGTQDEDYAGKMLNYNATFTKLKDIHQIAIVSPSNWLLNLSSSSKVLGLFTHYRIPYGINSEIFKPLANRQFLRTDIGIKEEKKVLLFVAYSIANKRKGLDILISALKKIANKEDYILITVGDGNKEIEELGMAFIQMGMINTERRMCELYNIADVYIIPSLEDNLPNTVLESLMTGTPVIGFPIGGIPDMIIDGYNGLLTKNINNNSLAESINFFNKNSVQYNREVIAKNAKTNYDMDQQVQSYVNLYNKMLNGTA